LIVKPLPAIVLPPPVSRRERERVRPCRGCLSWPAFKRAAHAAFPSGDLPVAPAGKEAALSRVAMAPVNYFPPPPEEGGFASRSKIVARLPSSALLRP
jgi:hypothetical protein